MYIYDAPVHVSNESDIETAPKFLVFSNNAVWYIRKYCDLNKYLVMRSTCVREGSEVTLLSSTTGDNNCTLSGVTKWSDILQKKNLLSQIVFQKFQSLYGFTTCEFTSKQCPVFSTTFLCVV